MKQQVVYMGRYPIINAQIKKKKLKARKKDMQDYFVPERCEDYEVPQFKVPVSDAKGYQEKLKAKLGKVLAFIDLNKQRRFRDCCTIMPIPTTERRYINIAGSHQNMSNLISFMEYLGLIELYDESYQFNAYYNIDNHSKRYKYYVENEQLIIDYCKERKINCWREVDNRTIVQKCKIANFDNDKVRFGNVHLLKPDDYSVREFEDYISDVLHENYPDLSYYQDLANYINEVYYEDYPDFRVRYDITYTWNKGNKSITRIGIRATNSLVSAKNKNELNECYHGLYKQNILDTYGLNLHKDVKSSVPRLTLSLNMGCWVKEDVDVYYLVYDRLSRKVGDSGELQNNSAKVQMFHQIRQDLKDLHLRAYFDSPTTLGRNTCHAMDVVDDRQQVYEAMRLYRETIEEVEGYVYGSEIFYHESNIYMMVLKELLDNGYFVWQVYDSWYARKEGVTQEEFETYVTDLVETIANDYIFSFE